MFLRKLQNKVFDEIVIQVNGDAPPWNQQM
jgi:hypothetical protein